MAALEISYPSNTLPQSLDYPYLQIDHNLTLKQSTAQNLLWDLDECLPFRYFSNTSSSPELSDYIQAGYLLDCIPSLDAAPNHETNIGSLRNRTREFLTTGELSNQLSAQTYSSDNVSDITDIQLRAASRRAKSRLQPSTSNTPVNARECHNHVKKQYHARLKLQFERLLAVLPASKAHSLDVRDNRSSSGQALSKGQVLDLAGERILQLEKELATMASTLPIGHYFV